MPEESSGSGIEGRGAGVGNTSKWRAREPNSNPERRRVRLSDGCFGCWKTVGFALTRVKSASGPPCYVNRAVTNTGALLGETCAIHVPTIEVTVPVTYCILSPNAARKRQNGEPLERHLDRVVPVDLRCTTYPIDNDGLRVFEKSLVTTAGSYV